MIDTILFDLDGTLLQFTQDDFIKAYFSELKNVFAHLELDPKIAAKVLWAGTEKMFNNDGAKLNAERFWEYFTGALELSGERARIVEDVFERFYSNEFNAVKSVLKADNPELPRNLVRSLPQKGYTVVLATNPLFPTCAVTTRLGWIDLTPQDFCLITDYKNSTYCKPNHGYYREIFAKIDKEPQQCLMIGNNTREDMSAGDLGAETFLVTDCLENEANLDISAFRHGTLAELAAFLTSLPNVTA